MLKSKQAIYFLITAVVFVWGLISYRIFNAVNTTDEIGLQAPVKQKKEAFDDFSLPKDTAKLLLNYRDPFNLVQQKDTIKRLNPKSASKVLRSPIQSGPNWSSVTYSGYIRNSSSKKLIALLNINGQCITLKEGETKAQVKLIKNLRDSVKISYQGKTKFILLKTAL